MKKTLSLHQIITNIIKYARVMDKTLRNTIIGIIATIVITFVVSWIDVKGEIAVLRNQVENDHQAIENTNKDIADIKEMLQDIRVGVQHLNDVKKDK